MRAMRARLGAGMCVCAWVVSSCAITVPDAEHRIGSAAFVERANTVLAEAPNRLVAAACTRGTPAPTTARGWQRTMDALQAPTWRSADVGVTTKLSDGRVLWVFGDTVRPRGTSPRVAANSMLVSDGGCFAEMRTPEGGAPIDGFPGRRRCWPNAALAVPMKGADAVLVTCSRVDPGDDGLYDFTYRGLTLAVFVVEPGGAPQPVSTLDVTPDTADARAVNWGSALVAHDGWIYVYGSQQPAGSAGKGAYVARARLAQVGDHAGWQFWNGRSFTGDDAAARPVLLAAEGVSQTFSVVPWKGAFVLVSKQGGEFGANIGVWKAPHPQGPWSGLKAVPEPYSRGSGVVAYQPLAHPEFVTAGGKLLVTMSRTAEKFADLIADPSKGRPLFVEVPAG